MGYGLMGIDTNVDSDNGLTLDESDYLIYESIKNNNEEYNLAIEALGTLAKLQEAVDTNVSVEEMYVMSCEQLGYNAELSLEDSTASEKAVKLIKDAVAYVYKVLLKFISGIKAVFAKLLASNILLTNEIIKIERYFKTINDDHVPVLVNGDLINAKFSMLFNIEASTSKTITKKELGRMLGDYSTFISSGKGSSEISGIVDDDTSLMEVYKSMPNKDNKTHKVYLEELSKWMSANETDLEKNMRGDMEEDMDTILSKRIKDYDGKKKSVVCLGIYGKTYHTLSAYDSTLYYDKHSFSRSNKYDVDTLFTKKELVDLHSMVKTLNKDFDKYKKTIDADIKSSVRTQNIVNDMLKNTSGNGANMKELLNIAKNIATVVPNAANANLVSYYYSTRDITWLLVKVLGKDYASFNGKV